MTEQTTIVPEPTAARPGHRGHLTAYVHDLGAFDRIAGWVLWNPQTERYDGLAGGEQESFDTLAKARRWLRARVPKGLIVGMRGRWAP